MRRLKLHFVIAACVSVLVLVACNLQKAALKIFTDQGLTVLQPARDYIKLGGIVVLPKKGRPQYIDPYDMLGGSDGTYSNFNAVIQQQTQNQSTGIEAAVGTLASFIPVKAGLNFTTGQQVQLGEIDTGGTRYTTQQVLALLTKDATKRALQNMLQPGAGNRVFLIQEVYTGKSMSLKSSSNVKLDASYAGTGSLPTCDTSSGGGGAGSTSGKASSGGNNGGTPAGSSANGSGAGAGGGTNPVVGSSHPSKSSGNRVTSARGASTGNTGTTAKRSTSNSSNSGGSGISFGVCRTSDFEISFQSQNAIPFAVRLNEVVLKPGDVLDVNITNFTIPGTLGGSEVSATAIVDPDYPVFEDMEHVTH